MKGVQNPQYNQAYNVTWGNRMFAECVSGVVAVTINPTWAIAGGIFGFAIGLQAGLSEDKDSVRDQSITEANVLAKEQNFDASCRKWTVLSVATTTVFAAVEYGLSLAIPVIQPVMATGLGATTGQTFGQSFGCKIAVWSRATAVQERDF